MRRLALHSALMLVLAGCTRVVYEPPYHFTSAASNELVTDHLTDLSRTERVMSRAATGDTDVRESASARVDERVVVDRPGPRILRVVIGHDSVGDYYDSLLVRRSDLTPIREHLAYPESHVDKHFEYYGTRVHQTNVIDGSTRAFDAEYTLPPYALNELELIIRSLPFHPYYTAVMPLYSEANDKLEIDSVYVINDQPGRRWTVRFADPANVVIYGIDASTHSILSVDATSRKTKEHAHKLLGPS